MPKPYTPFDATNPFAAFPLSSINLAEQFEQGAFLIEESDTHLSAVLGCKVISIYPEDMGVGNNIETRKTFLRNFLRTHLPAAKLRDNDIFYDIFASAESAQITQFYNGVNLIGAIILKPSKSLSSEQTIANASGLDVSLIRSQLSKMERDFLDCQHEVGHILTRKSGQFQGDSLTDNQLNEMLSDLTSILAYRERQDKPVEIARVTNAIIQERALCGFLFQPPRYWLAPALAEATSYPYGLVPFKPQATTIDPYNQTWASYAELRARTAAQILGIKSLDHTSSEEIKAILHLWDSGHYEATPPDENWIIDAIRSIEAWDSDAFKAHRFSGSLIVALSEVASAQPLDEFAKKCTVQILRAAQQITPTLAVTLPSYALESQMSFAPSAP